MKEGRTEEQLAILYVTHPVPSRRTSSASPYLGSRLAHLRKQGVKADVLSLNRVKKGPWHARRVLKFAISLLFPLIHFERYAFQGETYTIYKVLYGPISRVWLPLIVRVLVRLKGYALLHYHFLWCTRELAYLKQRLRLPVVITVHGSDLHASAAGDPVARKVFGKAIAQADRVIYVSRALHTMAEQIGLATDRDLVIPNGYEPDWFKPMPAPSEECVVGFVGHPRAVKRAEAVPQIFAQIKAAIPEAILWMIGPPDCAGNVTDAIRRSIKELEIGDAVHSFGALPPAEVGKQMARMRVLLLPSRAEGFPCVAIEARACGVPVVGSSNGGIPEAVADAGVIVPDGDRFETRFAEAAIQVLRHPPSPNAIAAKTRDYGWDRIVAREMELYREVLSHAKHGDGHGSASTGS